MKNKSIICIRVEGFNTPPFRALRKGIKPRIQIPFKNNIPRPFRAGLLILLFLSALSAHSGGLMEKNLVNTQEIGLENIDIINITYTWENVVLIESNSDKLIIKEYMTRDNSDYYARISISGNRISIERGNRPLGIGSGILFNTFNVHVEIHLPKSYTGNINIAAKSGNIQSNGVFSCSEIKLNTSSGNISGNSIAAENISLSTSSGRINIININGNVSARSSSGNIYFQTVNGNAGINTRSGRITIDNINGNVETEAASGGIRLNMVNGSIIAKASSGNIRCEIGENAGNVSLSTRSGRVTLNVPNNLAFNFFSTTRSGNLRTPFSDKLFSSISDRNSVQGVIGVNNSPDNANIININIRTTSGSIRIIWSGFGGF